MPKVDYLMQQLKVSISLLQTGIDILSMCIPSSFTSFTSLQVKEFELKGK
jgi:hypothetical protein